MARILAVEDNPDNLELMTYLLGASGHTVIPAMTGELGVALARTERPDLVVLDIQLPDTNGYEVLSRLRADTELARLPVIAVTAYAMVGDRDDALGAGFDGYVSKPIDPTTFGRTIDTFLPAALHGHEPVAQWSQRPDQGSTDVATPTTHGHESVDSP
jgi:CheY-like chemotaxis protein